MWARGGRNARGILLKVKSLYMYALHVIIVQVDAWQISMRKISFLCAKMYIDILRTS